MKPGEIHRHDAFYRNPATGELERKYLLGLAVLPSGDIVARLLTSRPHGRPQDPRCYHGMPYAGFFLGVIGGALTANSWLDLRYLDDLDAVAVQRLQERGVMSLITSLEQPLFRQALECAAAADDTTRAQEHAMRDLLASMGSS